MAASNVNTGFAKCFISFMAIVILLQGCAYLALALYGITQEKCTNGPTTDISKNPFEFLMHLIYFQKEVCGIPKIAVTEISNEVEIEMDWSKSFAITSRLNIFLITYAAVSAFWIVTSLIVLASLCGTVTKIVAAVSFWPWFLIVLGGSILDGVATGYFIVDIMHTLTANDAFAYIGAATTDPTLMNVLQSFDTYFVTPAVVLALLSSRVVFIWLLNIFGTGFCLSLSRVLAENNSNSVNSHKTTYLAANVQASSADNNEEISRSINGRPQLILSQTPDQITSNRQRLGTPQGNTTYLNTDTHPDRLDYPAANAGPSSPSSPFEHTNQLSTESPLNGRYAKGDFSVLPNHRVSAELRSQLPWSYTSAQAKSQASNKPQRPMYPQIPEPDYNDNL